MRRGRAFEVLESTAISYAAVMGPRVPFPLEWNAGRTGQEAIVALVSSGCWGASASLCVLANLIRPKTQRVDYWFPKWIVKTQKQS